MNRDKKLDQSDNSDLIVTWNTAGSCPPIAVVINSLFGVSGPRTVRPEFSASLDLHLTEKVANHLGVRDTNIPPEYTLFKNSLDQSSITKHEKYWEAKTKLPFETSSAMCLLEFSNARYEVHGFNTLPACYTLAEEFLGQSAQNLEIVSHKISTPIKRDLTLAIYEDKRPAELAKRESCDLLVHFRDRERNIFIRGYQSEQPITTVIDSRSIPRCSVDTISKEQARGSFKKYSLELSGIDSVYQDFLQSSCGLQSSVFFAAVHRIGRKLIDSGEIDRENRADYISRIGNLVLGSPTLFCNSNLTATVSWDESQMIRTENAVYRKINFEVGYGADTASAVIELALVDLSLL